jgi:hypothetical protein
MPFVPQLGNPAELFVPDLVAATEINVSGLTVICKLPSSILRSIGNFIQAQLIGASGDADLNGVYHSYCAASGNAYDADTTPTPYAFGEALAFTLPAATPMDSDVLAFAQSIKPTLIAFNAGTTCSALAAYVPGAVSYISTTAVQQANDAVRGATYASYKDMVFFLQSLLVSP